MIFFSVKNTKSKSIQIGILLLFVIIKTMLCVYIGALEGEARISGEMKDVTIQRGGSCNNDNTCHNHCPGCAITQCILNQCVCTRCDPPRPNLRVKSHM